MILLCSSIRFPFFCGIIVIYIISINVIGPTIYCDNYYFTICSHFLSPVHLCFHPLPFVLFLTLYIFLYVTHSIIHYKHIILYHCFSNQLKNKKRKTCIYTAFYSYAIVIFFFFHAHLSLFYPSFSLTLTSFPWYLIRSLQTFL